MASSTKREPVAYLLALTTGLAGGHNFYLGRFIPAGMQLVLFGVALGNKWLFIPAALWLVGELIFMNKLVDGANGVKEGADEGDGGARMDGAALDSFNAHQAAWQAAFDAGDMRGAAKAGVLGLQALRNAVRGPHETTAVHLSNLGEVCRRLGDYTRARAYLEESVAMGKQLGLALTDGGMASSVNNLALVYADMGDYAGAERLYKQLQAVRPPGQATNESLRLLNNLANLYGKMGQPVQAELSYERALALAKKIPDIDTTLHTNVLNSFASTLMDREAWDRSRVLYHEALALQEQSCKGVSREAATSHNDLGVMAEKLGDLAAAQKHQERALQLKQICVPDDLLDIALTEHNLGGVYYAQGNFAMAGKMAAGLVATYTRVLGAAHPQTEQARINLAAIPPEYLPQPAGAMSAAART